MSHLISSPFHLFRICVESLSLSTGWKGSPWVLSLLRTCEVSNTVVLCHPENGSRKVRIIRRSSALLKRVRFYLRQCRSMRPFKPAAVHLRSDVRSVNLGTCALVGRNMAQLQNLQYILTIIQFLVTVSVHATPLRPPLQPSVNLYPSRFNTSGQIGLPVCTQSNRWIPHEVLYADCLLALDVLRRAEGAKSSTQPFEFLLPGAQKTTHLLPLLTPRKYTSKTCSITIVMLAIFPVQFLPPQAKKKWYNPTDIATLDEITMAAGRIAERCIKDNGETQAAGWEPVGREDQTIGVFVWESGSWMDRVYSNEHFSLHEWEVYTSVIGSVHPFLLCDGQSDQWRIDG